MQRIMTLGGIIAVLKRKQPKLSVRFDFVYFRPTTLRSYRGYYDHLALGYTNEFYDQDGKPKDTTVASLLAELEAAVGKIFSGYKGGDYRMEENTPVWVADSGEAGGTAVVDVRDDGSLIRLITACVD